MASLSSSLQGLGGGGRRAIGGLHRPTVLASRSALTSQQVAMPCRTLFTRPKPKSPVRSLVTVTLLGFAATFGVAYHLDSRSAIHRWIAIPVLQAVTDPETAQKLAVKLLSLGVMPRDMVEDDALLETEVAGLKLSNPIGLAAGFDKQAEAIDGLLNLGFGIVEVGSVTPEPQPGNEQPRYFRLTQDRGAINRFGFNSDGHQAVLARLHHRIQQWVLGQSTLAQSRVPLPDSSSDEAQLLARTEAGIAAVLERDEVPRSLRPGQLLFVNLGKNKTSEEASVDDYVKGVKTLGQYADAVVVNVSSPNTPGLRGLQRRGILQELMTNVVRARDALPPRGQGRNLPILVKIAPDLDQAQLHDIADAALASGIDGLIVSNTTVQRPKTLLSSPDLTNEKGGLSGAPLKPLALQALTTVRARVGDKIALIGCGGIHSGADALDFAKAGASAIELYTSFGYEGVGHPRRVKDELSALLREQGKTWKQVVGTGLEQDGTKPKVPSNEKEATRSGGAAERMGEAVASVKSELEGLRRSLGMPEEDKKRTAAPFFQPDPNDKEYVSLLDKVHAALGRGEGGRNDKPEAKTFEADDMTRAEALRARLGSALHDPSVPASQTLLGTGAQSTTTSMPPQSGRIEAERLTQVTPRSSGSNLTAYAEGRVGMGGKAEFNKADRQRVV